MMKINWKTSPSKPKELRFEDILVGTAFVNVGGYGQGAVYIKTVKEVDLGRNEYYMMEVAKSKLWNPTKSVIEVVDLEINIPLERPSIYD